MKDTLCHLLASFCMFAVVFGATAIVTAAAKDGAKGSIHRSGEVKTVDLASLATTTFQQALDVALAKARCAVIKVELEVEDGNLMYSFEIVGAHRKVTDVEIDTGNGNVLDTGDETAEVEKESGMENKAENKS